MISLEHSVVVCFTVRIAAGNLTAAVHVANASVNKALIACITGDHQLPD